MVLRCDFVSRFVIEDVGSKVLASKKTGIFDLIFSQIMEINIIDTPIQ